MKPKINKQEVIMRSEGFRKNSKSANVLPSAKHLSVCFVDKLCWKLDSVVLLADEISFEFI